jgi:hypothetical protein
MRAHGFINNIFTFVSSSLLPSLHQMETGETQFGASCFRLSVRQLLLVVTVSLSFNDHFLLFPADVV